MATSVCDSEHSSQVGNLLGEAEVCVSAIEREVYLAESYYTQLSTPEKDLEIANKVLKLLSETKTCKDFDALVATVKKEGWDTLPTRYDPKPWNKYPGLTKGDCMTPIIKAGMILRSSCRGEDDPVIVPVTSPTPVKR